MSLAETYMKIKNAYRDTNTVLEDEIVSMIGEDGLRLMVNNHLIVPYGTINNRQLYLLL